VPSSDGGHASIWCLAKLPIPLSECSAPRRDRVWRLAVDVVFRN